MEKVKNIKAWYYYMQSACMYLKYIMNYKQYLNGTTATYSIDYHYQQ